jgi:hypothetical protein
MGIPFYFETKNLFVFFRLNYD